MKKIYLFIFVLFLLFSYSCKNSKAILWYDNLDKAMNIAKNNKKIVK